MYYQRPADGWNSPFITWAATISCVKLGRLQAIPKLKLPLNESERVRFYFMSLYFIVIYPAPTLSSNTNSGSTLESSAKGKQPSK